MIWDFLKYQDRAALIDDQNSILTYGELEAFSHRLYKAVGGRTLLFILCTNSIGSAAGYAYCIHRGVVPALLSAGTDAVLLERLMEMYEPSYLWCPQGHMLTSKYQSVFEEKGYCLLDTGYSKHCCMYSELALLLTTSGSTGSPKFVRQSYRNIRSNAVSIAEYLQIDMDERPI